MHASSPRRFPCQPELARLLQMLSVFAERERHMSGVHFRLAGLLLTCFIALPAPAEARLVVDRVVVRGTTDVSTQVLTARMHLYSGDPVDFAALQAAEQRLIESGLFSSVRVFIDLPNSEAVRRM